MHRGKQSTEQAKDFKGAMKRLMMELKRFHVLIVISFILAIVASILSIIAPDHLATLTDTISEGLVVNQENLQELTTTVSERLSEEELSRKIPEILDIQMDAGTIGKIMADSSISAEDKRNFQEVLGSLSTENTSLLLEMPDSILNYILPDSTYESVTVTTEDKKLLLQSTSENFEFSEAIQTILFPEVTIDGVTISSQDQYNFIKVASTLNADMDTSFLYQKIDEMPESIRVIVEPSMDMDKIQSIVIFLAVIYICSGLFTFGESLIMTYVSNHFAQELRRRISHKINVLPLKYFDKHVIGDTLSRVTNDVDMIAQSMNQSLSILVSSVTLLLGTVIMMFVTNWILALTAMLSSIIGFIGMTFVLSKSQKYFVRRQVELGNLNGHIEEVYSGLNVVKAYNGKREVTEKFHEYNQNVQDSDKKSQFLSGLMHPMMSFIGNFGYVAVCIVGAMLTMNGTITFGVIIAFITYVRLFTSPLTQIAQAFTSLQSTAAASERVFEFLDEEEMPKETTKVTLKKSEVKGDIEFSNVVFQYDGNPEPTIKNFSAKAKAGEKIAIVGPTGAGKTTMVNLLMKFYDINSGDIKIDGVSTKDLTRENIHELFTMVLQDTWLFEGTVKENIVYNKEGVSDEEVKAVCKEIGLDHFIRTLPNGYNSMIGDNDTVSSGQKQLLTIARSMLEDTPFLILDEATSNVDTRTEELVQEAMDKLTKGKTSFIIAHRLSTIRNADLILVMKDGNIIETGNHDELMKQNGFYAQLYNSQFEL